ncbi:hypothetical protein BGL34_00350 [Fructilactobacillus lindneri]|uniref:DUF1694 domain-containing protein n=2 Tax=Fructilactobacillus lindneri TaxID=53444 RepID=A0A0R2JXK8_9LACO|nr:YueI family protein [Fructilactobacillus lindneri]ANZ58356.1 hypothetical protein AYR60_06230 [Fructilactobacillus lindneri]ANZ59678.1 hypothetical protein AYR59_06485 [Fructilactobacillus lindneri]KRN79191.1 hypothetical protein IV52_GL000597 [Fructilactobacillus lindneri DSM 20690 = JCM 11027]POG98539.1 hypothetical protein BGL31_00940 [Fructilactobacillus lindneri]POH03927.1 hypothetical protein BGL32_00880 [Fructilactobacillus lindneri]
MSSDNGNVQNRLDQAINGGTPKINPDEQRKYLGTFRERVAFAITVSQVSNKEALTQVEKIIQEHPNYTIIINGNLPTEKQSPYLKAATANNVKFTLKTDKIYETKPEDYGIIIAAPEAIHVDNIDYHPTENQQSSSDKSTSNKKESFWKRLFH